MKFIDNVEKNTVLDLEGPVTIKGDVSDGAQIKVKEGTLKIEGKVGNKVTMTCTAAVDSVTSATGGSVNIVGTSGDNLTVTCDGGFTAKGNIGDVLTVTAHKGNGILPQEIGAYARVMVENGDLTLFDHGQKGDFKALGGNVNIEGSKKLHTNICADIPTDRQDGNNIPRKIVIQNGRLVNNSSTRTAVHTSSNNNNNADNSDDGHETEDSDGGYEAEGSDDSDNNNKNKNKNKVAVTPTVTRGRTITRTVHQTGGTARMCINSIVIAGSINTYNARGVKTVVHTGANAQDEAKPGATKRSSNNNNSKNGHPLIGEAITMIQTRL